MSTETKEQIYNDLMSDIILTNHTLAYLSKNTNFTYLALIEPSLTITILSKFNNNVIKKELSVI